MRTKSFVLNEWVEGAGEGVPVDNAITGENVSVVSSHGINFEKLVSYGRDVGGPALRKMTIHDRANMLKAVAQYLIKNKKRYYALSLLTGATRSDSWIDIEGGLGTFFSFSSIARREFANETFIVEDSQIPLSAKGSFLGRHILVPKEGVSVHINAFNFPCWGMLEKIAPSLIAGVPVIVKPATPASFMAEAMVQDMVASGLMPEGSIQLVCGSLGDTLDHLNEQDTVTFTGSAWTGQKLRAHPNLLARSIPFTMEADSVNCSILGASVSVDDPEFSLFVKEVAREMTTKAGQKCTAIRRVIVPRHLIDAVGEAISQRLAKVVIGDPAVEGVKMGALVGQDQRQDVWQKIDLLKQECDVVFGGQKEFDVVGADVKKGAFCQPTLLRCDKPLTAQTPHDTEAFGPVSTLMPYDGLGEAICLAKMGKGSLTGSVFSHDNEEIKTLILGTAAYHGRMPVINRDCAEESTGHGSPLPQLKHGGPGRAGGGEELAGSNSIKHYMQRAAIQGSPSALTALTNEYHTGAIKPAGDKHLFRKYFEELSVGESLLTHRRTVTEADVVNFGCLSGDHFYAHFDETAAADSLFGKRVAHGYFIISAAAGLFVDPAPGPVLANYGMENLRFVEPVGLGDTIQARLTVKRKIEKPRREPEDKLTGVVEWDVEVTNQQGDPVALYTILTMVELKNQA